jgi:hypothetical protein
MKLRVGGKHGRKNIGGILERLKNNILFDIMKMPKKDIIMDVININVLVDEN